MNNQLTPTQLDLLQIEAARIHGLELDALREHHMDLASVYAAQFFKLRAEEASLEALQRVIANILNPYYCSQSRVGKAQRTLFLQKMIYLQANALEARERK